MVNRRHKKRRCSFTLHLLFCKRGMQTHSPKPCKQILTTNKFAVSDRTCRKDNSMLYSLIRKETLPPLNPFAFVFSFCFSLFGTWEGARKAASRLPLLFLFSTRPLPQKRRGHFCKGTMPCHIKYKSQKRTRSEKQRS